METLTVAESPRSLVETRTTLVASGGPKYPLHRPRASSVRNVSAVAVSPVMTAVLYRWTTPAGVDSSNSCGAPRKKTTASAVITSSAMAARMARRIRSGFLAAAFMPPV